MNPASRGSQARLPFSLAQQVDQVCDRFEDAWAEGPRPCIEDYLGGQRRALDTVAHLNLGTAQGTPAVPVQ